MLLLLLGLLGIGAASGQVRLDLAKDKVDREKADYDSLHLNLGIEQSLRTAVVDELKKLASTGFRNIATAERMLSPLSRSAASFWLPDRATESSTSIAIRNTKALSSDFYAAASVGTGLAASGALWFGTQMLGISSTGMPIVFLNGAALHNAALACLGGGSLLSGGGGMVAGGAVLASAVVVPAALFFGYKTHKEANRLNAISLELTSANQSNRSLLLNLRGGNTLLATIREEMSKETERFEAVVKETSQCVMRFGPFSHLYRKARARWWGNYYSEAEFVMIEDLTAAANTYTNFLSSLKERFN